MAPNPGAVPRTAVLTAAGVAVEVRQEPGGADLYTVPPCRVLDTRLPTDGPALAAGTERVFPVAGLCGIPATARAVSLNVTVAAPTDRGHLRLYPGDTPTPTASTINYLTGQNRANNAIVPLGADGTLAVFCGQSAGTTHVVVDVNGYCQ